MKFEQLKVNHPRPYFVILNANSNDDPWDMNKFHMNVYYRGAVVAVKRINDDEFMLAPAVCSPSDQFVRKVGISIAKHRLENDEHEEHKNYVQEFHIGEIGNQDIREFCREFAVDWITRREDTYGTGNRKRGD